MKQRNGEQCHERETSRVRHQWILELLILWTICGILHAAVAAPAESKLRWLGSWATTPSANNVSSGDLPPQGKTFREFVHLSAGGTGLRIKLTNELGIDPLSVNQVTIARSDGNALQGGLRTVTFAGKSRVTIPAGSIAVSDPLVLPASASADFAITIFVPSQPIHIWTRHSLALATNYEAPGDQARQFQLVCAKEIHASYLLKAVDVVCPSQCAAIVALGDSITDGQGSTLGSNRRWTDVLAARLGEARSPGTISVLNEGIAGNRLLHDGNGPNALERLDRDVLTQSGARYVIVLEGINDIGHATRASKPEDPVSVEDLEYGLSQIVLRAHQLGYEVFGATLTPAAHGSPSGEALRSALNEWVRHGSVFDHVIDFDQILRDPKHPKRMLPVYDSGDSLHPSDAGYRRMGEAIDLNLFEAK